MQILFETISFLLGSKVDKPSKILIKTSIVVE